MICPYCGNKNPEDIQFCNFCGGPLSIPTEKQVSESAAFEPAEDLTIDNNPVETPIDQTASQPKAAFPAAQKASRGIFGNKYWLIGGCLLILLILVGCGALVWGLLRISNRVTTVSPTLTALAGPILSTAANTPVSVPELVASPTSLPGASITSSSVPNPTQLPAINITASPRSSTSTVLFSDNFSDTGSGWDRADESDYFSDYYTNTYRIVVHTSMSDSWANPDSNKFGDVSVEVDATKNGGPDDNDFGLICRYVDVNQFYYGVISSDGYFGITKVTSDSSKLLGRDTLEFNAAINQGSATNHLRLDCVGDVITLYVNGQQIDQQIDGAYSTGNTGLIAGAYDTPGTDILFDNFFVYQP